MNEVSDQEFPQPPKQWLGHVESQPQSTKRPFMDRAKTAWQSPCLGLFFAIIPFLGLISIPIGLFHGVRMTSRCLRHRKIYRNAFADGVAGLLVNGGILMILFTSLLWWFHPMSVLGIASGLYEGSRFGTPFEEAHQRAVKTFVESEGFGPSRIRRVGLWNEHAITFNNQLYDTHDIRLIGTTEEYGPRAFLERFPQRKEEISQSHFRPLSENELRAIERLRKGKSLWEELPSDFEAVPNSKRIVAPIIASQDCLKCHVAKTGEMLGALDYLLVPHAKLRLSTTAKKALQNLGSGKFPSIVCFHQHRQLC